MRAAGFERHLHGNSFGREEGNNRMTTEILDRATTFRDNLLNWRVNLVNCNRSRGISGGTRDFLTDLFVSIGTGATIRRSMVACLEAKERNRCSSTPIQKGDHVFLEH